MKFTRPNNRHRIRDLIADAIAVVSLFAGGWMLMLIAYGLGY